MKSFPTASGLFSERPFFRPKEIERICEDELRKFGCFPTCPEPVRIERFIEKRFHITPVYEELPEGVLGYTTFGKSGVTGMHIASAMVESGAKSDERRANSTLAHETGHGLLHTHLFAFANEGLSLFGGDPDVTPTKILCRQPPKTKGFYDGKWWELQANMVIGPLLMPRSLVTKAVQPFIQKQGMLEIGCIDPSARDEAARHLADVFEVNPIVATIRLGELYPAEGAQLTL